MTGQLDTSPCWTPAQINPDAVTGTRILHVDDHPVVRAGVRHLLAGVTDLQVVAEAGTGRQALDIVRGGGVDVVLLDIAMPGQSGIDVLAFIRARWPLLPVLMFSAFSELDYAPTLLRLGASGYLNKGCEPAELVAALRAVARGRKHVSAAVAERLADGLGAGSSAPVHEQLSERELQVFLRLAQGETIGRLADGLCLSVKTVSTYRSRVMEKMRLVSNSELTHYALTKGLIR